MKQWQNIVDINIKSFFTENDKVHFLTEVEKKMTLGYSEKRLIDFSTGRFCARKALLELGIEDVSILIGKDKGPIWPVGIVGSISHCDSLAGVIVAKKSEHISLGLDIEEIGRVTSDLFDLVFTEEEKSYLSSFTGRKLEEQSTLIFSIKEAFYKYQHPITKTFMDFLEVQVSLPDFKEVKILSEIIPPTSIIRNNLVGWWIENNCVVTVINSSC